MLCQIVQQECIPQAVLRMDVRFGLGISLQAVLEMGDIIDGD